LSRDRPDGRPCGRRSESAPVRAGKDPRRAESELAGHRTPRLRTGEERYRRRPCPLPRGRGEAMTINSYLTNLANQAILRDDEKAGVQRSITTLQTRLADHFGAQMSQ